MKTLFGWPATVARDGARILVGNQATTSWFRPTASARRWSLISIPWLAVALGAILTLAAAPAWADEVGDWNAVLFQASLTAGTSPLVMSRNAALVHAAIFDAINGIERRYTPMYVQPDAPRGASRRAAAVQAAYAMLVRLYESQTAALLDPARTASLQAIVDKDALESSVSIGRGLAWGQSAADGVWAARVDDGISAVLPPYVPGVTPGEWRPTPLAFAPPAGRQFATMTTWVIPSFNSFRPLPPPGLATGQYALDFAEVKLMGQSTSAARTADETLYTRFWNSASAARLWDVVALSLSAEHHYTLSENARLLALVNVAMADAAIGCFDAKYFYNWWRPVTAIQNDGVPADATWLPLLVTPAFPDYVSAHSCTSAAGAAVLTHYFGENTLFTVTSDSPAMAGVSRSFSSFSAALDEVANARVFGGIHFRAACIEGQFLGAAVGDYVWNRAFQPVSGGKTGQVP